MMQKIWVVELDSKHSGYTNVKLQRSLPDNTDYTAVMVDARKLLDCYSREMPEYILPPVNRWKPERREGIRTYLDPVKGAVPMARIAFRTATQKRIFRKPRFVGVVAFINGRHRTLYMSFAGASHFPVEVHVNEANLLKEYCASTESY